DRSDCIPGLVFPTLWCHVARKGACMRLPKQAARNALVLVICALVAVVVITGGIARGDNKLMWVQVKEDSPDAVMLKTASRWSDPVATLPFNAQVEVLADLSEREKNPQPFFQVSYRGRTGFVKRSTLSEQSPMQHAERETELTVTGAAAANTAGKGFGDQKEKGRGASARDSKEARNKGDWAEPRIAREFYNKNWRTAVGAPTVGLKKYSEFGKTGGLIAGEEE